MADVDGPASGTLALHRAEDETARRPTIAYQLSTPGNARLLDRVLAGRYRVRHDRLTRGEGGAAAPFDLLIVDPGVLDNARPRLREYRAQALPAVLPVLLLATAGQAPEAWVRRDLGHTVDDVLRIPTTAAELTARIDNLLRLRELSRLQESTSRELRGVVRALHTLSTCDEILVRSDDEDDLLNRICRAVVETEGYRLAWIGFAVEAPDKPVAIRAHAGPAFAYLDDIRIQWAEGVVATVMRSGKPRVVTDIGRDPLVAVDPARARDHGLASAIMLPLPVTSESRGCLAIYSERPDFFGREPRQLLERLARNLTFGLKALRTHRESQHQASQIRSLAYSDALTGLSNRQDFLDRLGERLEKLKKVGGAAAVLFIDLDKFKMVNDALGHQIGDQVLQRIGQRLRRLVRGSDLVARQGGDEFVVALFDSPRRDAGRKPAPAKPFQQRLHEKAEQILHRLREPVTLDGQEHRLGASIGISLFPEHGHDATLLVGRADAAMYEAKKQQDIDICQFSEEILERSQRRLSLEGRLYQAINRDELELYYQPVYRLDTLEIVAVEALVRWPQEDDSLLSPAEFLPVAEETGMIVQLGEWVLTTAGRQLRQWHDDGHSFRMMVNLSVRQLHGGSEIDRFAAAVRPYVHPSWVEFEVTEGALMSDPPAVEAKLRALHEHGFRLAIDDFGTGYSSLSRIKDLPFQTLKIDRMFVAGIGLPGKGETVTQTILQLARNLSLRAVAEGIETDLQHERLLAWGCGYGQGFWLSRPLPPAEMDRLLDSPPRP